MQSGIVLDDWKLPIFEELLTEAGFTYTQKKGPTKGCVSLFVVHAPHKLQELKQTIERCQRKAAELKN